MIKQINRILVVRNDSTTNWENARYILQKGELGIGFLENGNVIVKCGAEKDGNLLPWKECPQVEGVFENDFKITENFGKYTTDGKAITIPAKGKTFSQLIKDAFTDIKNPDIVSPSCSISSTGVVTDTGTLEIGSRVVKLSWVGEAVNGHYQYGSKKDGVFYPPETEVTQQTYKITGGDLIEGESALLSGELVLKEPFYIDSTETKNCGELNFYYAWNDSEYVPLNNIGAETSGQIMGDEGNITLQFNVTGYRTTCFYGTTKLEDFDESKITSEFIRDLPNKREDFGNMELQCHVDKGTTAIIIAVPQGPSELVSVFNSTIRAEMVRNFKVTAIGINGANEKYPQIYDVYYYIPVSPYESQAELTINLDIVGGND